MLCLQLTYIDHLAKCCFCGDYSVISYFCIWSGLQSYKEYVGKSICEQEHMDIVRNSCPAAGACGGMYTANTMASDCHWSSWHVPSCTGTYIPSAVSFFLWWDFGLSLMRHLDSARNDETVFLFQILQVLNQLFLSLHFTSYQRCERWQTLQEEEQEGGAHEINWSISFPSKEKDWFEGSELLLPRTCTSRDTLFDLGIPLEKKKIGSRV